MASIRTSEVIQKLIKTSVTTLQLPLGSRINIGGQQYNTLTSLTLNTATVGAGGVDATIVAGSLYYVYAVLSSNQVYLIASLNSSLPSGFTQARCVGGFTTNASGQIDVVGDYPVNISVAGNIISGGNTDNLIINGAFDFWQRGTTFTTPTNGAYCADRWSCANASSASLSYSRLAAVPSGSRSTYSLRATVANAGTEGTRQYNGINYKPEGLDITRYYGKVCTMSFWCRSSYAGTFGFSYQGSWGTGTQSWATNVTINAADTWEYKTITVPFTFGGGTPPFDNTIATSFWWLLECDAGGTPGFGTLWTSRASGRTNWPLNATFDLADVMFNVGSIAAPFKRAGVTIGQELALCQRYYETLFYDRSVYFRGYTGIATVYRHPIGYKVTKRAAVAPTFVGTWTYSGVSSMNYDDYGVDFISLAINATNVGGMYDVYKTTSSTYIAIDAEI